MHFFNFLCLTFLFSTANAARILVDYACTYNYSNWDDWCYRLYSSPLSNYDDALKICRSDGADLASIHSAFADVCIRNLGPNGALIGLRFSEIDGTFKWSDGSPLDYTNYDDPDNFVKYHDYLGDCAQTKGGKWTNAQCKTDKLQFVCEKKATPIYLTPNDACPNASTIYTIPGMLLSPGYPGKYHLPIAAAQEGCFYKVVVKNNYVLKLKFEEISLDNNIGSVNVYRGWEVDEHNKVAAAKNDFADKEINVDYNRALLYMIGSTNGLWKVTWNTGNESAPVVPTSPTISTLPTPTISSSKLCPTRDTIYTAPEVVYSPDYPNIFVVSSDERSIECYYQVTAPGKYTNLKFDELRFKENEGRVTIYKGWNEIDANMWAEINSESEGQALMVEDSKALIRVYNASVGVYKISVSAYEDPDPCHNQDCGHGICVATADSYECICDYNSTTCYAHDSSNACTIEKGNPCSLTKYQNLCGVPTNVGVCELILNNCGYACHCFRDSTGSDRPNCQGYIYKDLFI